MNITPELAIAALIPILTMIGWFATCIWISRGLSSDVKNILKEMTALRADMKENKITVDAKIADHEHRITVLEQR